MIKNILWDFDGVILDSMKVKCDGFIELFKNHDINDLKKIEQFHYENGGVSRFEKIKYFYNQILMIDITKDEIEKLANEFATIISKKLFDKNSLIKDSVNFIKENHQKYNFHIVSGAEHKELNKLCTFFELENYFITIDGSPTKKDILVKHVIEKYNYNKNETILIGDALTDYNAAKSNNIGFYGYNNISLKKYKYIKTFKDISF